MARRQKPRLAVWKFASCDGCQLSLLDCEDELLDVADALEIANFPEASRAVARGPDDISLVEGSITTPHDAERIHKIRRASRTLITIGACATSGGIQALRNFKDVNDYISIVYATPSYIATLNKSTAIRDHVVVDFELRGCPISKSQLVEVLSAYLNGRKPNIPNYSVCVECKLKGNVCGLVAFGPMCLGPVTQAGCGALCPTFHRGCYGCFGPKESANTASLAATWRAQWITSEQLMRQFRSFNACAEAFRKESEANEKKTIKVDMLARVEGEGGLTVKVKDGKVTDVKFTIFEPPRFFEAFLRGRSDDEVADIVARICGICPVAYQMSAVHAIEDAFGVTVSEELRQLRRLLYCGEWIESHALHVFFLHAPDFLGYPDAIAMARDHGAVVRQALQLKKTGNDLVALVGGREIHPISVRVGGFYKVPTKAELAPLADKLKWARDAAIDAVKFAAGLPFPDFERDYEFVALRHSSDYPFNEGRLVSNKGLDIAVREYDQHFEEQQVAHSNALHSIRTGRGPYLVGPLARYNVNYDRLSVVAREAATSVGLGPTCHNPFKSIMVRAVEIVYAADEALRIIESYEKPPRSVVEFRPAPGVGYACTEAPRGILFHRYRINPRGQVLDAKIVPPTSQNQKMMEADLREYVTPRVSTPVDALTWQCEQVIRNFDPCISCATHFLKLSVELE